VSIKTEVLTAEALRAYPAIAVKDTSLHISPQDIWLLVGQKVIYAPELTTAVELIESGGYLLRAPSPRMPASGPGPAALKSHNKSSNRRMSHQRRRITNVGAAAPFLLPSNAVMA